MTPISWCVKWLQRFEAPAKREAAHLDFCVLVDGPVLCKNSREGVSLVLSSIALVALVRPPVSFQFIVIGEHESQEGGCPR